MAHNKEIATSLVLGAAFVVLGGLEIASLAVREDWMRYVSTGNVVLGVVLVLTAAVFLAAAKGFRTGQEGDAWLIVACGLALFVGLVALLTLAADAAEAYLLGNADFASWTPADDFTPAILMMVPCGAVLWYMLRSFWDQGTSAQATEARE